MLRGIDIAQCATAPERPISHTVATADEEMRMPLTERSLQRAAESMIADFGDGAEAEVDSRIVHAVDQDLPTVAQSWRLIRRFIVQLRNGSAAEPVSSTNGTGDCSGKS